MNFSEKSLRLTFWWAWISTGVGCYQAFYQNFPLTLLNWKIASCRPHWDFWSREWSKYRLREVSLYEGFTLLPFMLSWYRTLTHWKHWKPFIEKQRRVKLRHRINMFFFQKNQSCINLGNLYLTHWANDFVTEGAQIIHLRKECKTYLKSLSSLKEFVVEEEGVELLQNGKFWCDNIDCFFWHKNL